MNRLFVLLILLLASFSDFAQTRYIEVGSGGGISGAATIYRIQPDGKVLSGKGIADIAFSKQGRIRKSKAAKFCRKTAKLLLNSPEYNQPGNTYRFMSVTTQSKSVKITWNSAAQAAPPRIKKCYKKVMSAMNSIEFADM
jgi:hypothetical protein